MKQMVLFDVYLNVRNALVYSTQQICNTFHLVASKYYSSSKERRLSKIHVNPWCNSVDIENKTAHVP